MEYTGNGRPSQGAATGELLDQALPNNVDAERWVVGSCILDPSKLGDVAGTLQPRDFYDPALRRLYAHMLIMRNGGGGAIDAGLLVEHIKQAGESSSRDFGDDGAAYYIATVMGAVPVAAHAEHYAKIVREAADLRRLRQQAEGVLVAIAAGRKSAGEIRADLGAELSESVNNCSQRPRSAFELLADYPTLREPVIDGIARRGETVNFVAPSKFGKSWSGYSMSCGVATGTDWFGFKCDQGRVLLIDNELHPDTIAHRLRTVVEAASLPKSVLKSIDVETLRGKPTDIHTLGNLLEGLPEDAYRLIIADAWYRFLPAGTSENDNAQVAAIYNAIDHYTARLGAVWVNIHHSSKGDQSQKAVTDVGSGAGSQSRAADAHIVLRPHEDEGVVVMEAAVRSFAPVAPLALRWNYPLWEVAHDADPSRLRKPNHQRPEPTEPIKRDIVAKMVKFGRPVFRSDVEQRVTGQRKRVLAAWDELVEDGTIIEVGQEKKANHQSYPVYEVSRDESDV